MVALAVASLIVAVAALAVAAAVIWRELDFVKSAHNDAMQLARANSDMKFMPILLQTAAAISERIDDRVRQRVVTINAAAKPHSSDEQTVAPKTITEPPPMGTSSIIDDAHEISRGIRRFTAEFIPPEMAAREPGIGQDPDYPPEQI